MIPKQFVSNSELATFAECPLKWWLKYVKVLQAPKADRRLERGTAWHLMMQGRGEALKAQKNAREGAFSAMREIDERFDFPAEEIDILRWMYDGYEDRWHDDDQWEVLETEQLFELDMPIAEAPDLKYTGRIDAIWQHRKTGKIAVVDHKSASGRDVSKEGFINEMLMEDQFIFYSAARVRLGLPVDLVIRDVARTDRLKRTMFTEERFARIEESYPQATLDHVWEEKTRLASALVRAYNDPELLFSVPNPRQCSWKCEFMASHLDARSSGRDIVDVAINYGFVEGDLNAMPVELVEAEPSW